MPITNLQVASTFEGSFVDWYMVNHCSCILVFAPEVSTSTVRPSMDLSPLLNHACPLVAACNPP
jgi:hypothetical protein